MRSVSLSSSLESYSESYTTLKESSFENSRLSTRTKIESDKKSDSQTTGNCSRNLRLVDFTGRKDMDKLNSTIKFPKYRRTSPIIICELETRNDSMSCPSWDYLDHNDSDLNSNPRDDCDMEHDRYSFDSNDYSDCKKLEDSSEIKSPLFTSTPCKTQANPPDLINISNCEREISNLLETNHEKLSNIDYTLNSMEEDMKYLEQIAKRKELNNKKLQDSFSKLQQYLPKAEELNNSISNKSELYSQNLFSQYESSIDDIDCSRHHKDFKIQPIVEENERNCHKEEFGILRNDIISLRSRMGDGQTEIKGKSQEIQKMNKIEADIPKRKNLQDLKSNSTFLKSQSRIRQNKPSRDSEIRHPLLTAIESPVIEAANVITKSKLWRSVKLGLAVPLTLMFMGSMNLFLEPNCCDRFNFVSYLPYLEHRYGPPPI